MKAEEFSERQVELHGWPVNVSSYRLGETWHSKVDNVSPGAGLARATGSTREEAEQEALQRAGELLAKTRRNPV